VASQSANSSTAAAAAVESRNARNAGLHALPVNRDDDDVEGDLVSDGVVTWRRKLPDLSECGRATSTVDHHHHHHQRHSGKHLAVADSRKMSIPAALGADGATGAGQSLSRRDRRDAFAQQKSFSYEAAFIGRRLPPTPDELAAAARARRSGTVRGGSGGTTGATSTSHPVDRRRRMLMEAKKSYSLDDQIAPSHVAASEGHMYAGGGAAQHPAHYDTPRDAASRLQISRDTVRSAAREQPPSSTMSAERSPSSGGHRKLLMLHTMRALQHDHFDTTTTTTTSERGSDTHSARTGAASADTATTTTAAQTSSMSIQPKPAIVHEPPPRVPPPTSRVDRLPIARIWSRLKFDRRAVTASGKK